MKIARLLPETARNLKEVEKIEIEQGNKKEVQELIYERLSAISNSTYDVIFSPKLLNGELRFLSRLSEILIFDSSLFNEKAEILKDSIIKIKNGKTLEITHPLEFNGDYIDALLPFPFRDEVFETVIIREILDHDIIKEAWRVTKKGGKGVLVFPFGKCDPADAIKLLSIKFNVVSAREYKRYWIIEGVKRR
ncbi:MAG: hypothetical protein RXR59_05455 [Sulfolobus sp.]|jgi:hypothetical protein